MHPIIELVFARNTEAIKNAIKQGTSANQPEGMDRTILALAAACNYIDVMEAVVGAGADINKTNADDLGYTPLIEAAREGHLEAVKWLLDNGADIEGKDSREGGALLHAAIGAHKEVLEYLLAKGADVNAMDNNGRTAAHYLCQFAMQWGSAKITQTVNGVTTELENPQFKKHTEIFKILLDNMKEVNLFSSYGYTPLHHAAETNNVTFINMLLDHGAEVNIINPKDYTSLHAACDAGNLEAAQALVARHAFINIEDKDGFSPLLGAVVSGNVSLVKFLVEKGAMKDIAAKVQYGIVEPGDTPITVAQKQGNLEMMQLLYNSVN